MRAEHCQTHCEECCKGRREATPEDDNLYCCLNHNAQLDCQMPSAPPATRDKDVVQIYGCDSCWTKYSTKTDPCSCSEWEEDQRLQGDFEFGEPQSKTCCNSQIAEINERLDKICAKIEFYERYFGQADNQEEDIQKVCSECCESSPEPPKIIQKCEPTCESVSKIKAKDGKLPATTSLPSAKPQVEETSKSAGANIQSVNKAKAKAEETKQGEDKSRSSVDLSSKEKAERDICRYCCSRSSLKGIPSACVQQCKGKLNPCEEKLKRDPVQAEKCMKSSQNVTQAPKPPIPQCKGNQPVKCLSTTESKCKKSCKFLDENEKTEDPGSKKASGESVCCKCTSKSQTNVVKPIIKTGSGKCEGRCSYQILEQQPSQQEVESQKGTSQSFVQDSSIEKQ
ncbi:unnamed protein product [Callosobruchus maculatus]|uniref:Uncharacterized protein n=2 Tax=Callosobruchus maculatus TaxID=64391 RepID=A0A653BWJ9_CALMS|nr:unnamed protein product [Callosobruchus maculatus]